MTELKLCMDCKFFQAAKGYSPALCGSPEAAMPSPVTGEREPPKALDARTILYDCGWEAKLWFSKAALNGNGNGMPKRISEEQ